MKKELKWFGIASHCIVGHLCRFHLATEVGDYLVSTIGEYVQGGKDKKLETLGSGSKDFYETMVFPLSSTTCQLAKCGCGQRAVSGMELECQRYATRGAAQTGHMQYVKKYSSKRRMG